MDVYITKTLRTDRIRDGKAPLLLTVYWGGQRVRFSPKINIDVNAWNADKGEVRKMADGSRAINKRIKIYTHNLELFFEERVTEPTVEEVQAEIDRIRVKSFSYQPKADKTPVQAPAPDYPSLLDYVSRYRDLRKTDRSDTWSRSVKSMGNCLKAFRPDIDWQHLKLNVLNDWKHYMREELEFSDNTIHAYFGLLSGMCEYAERENIPVPRDHNWVETKTGEVIRPVLDDDDIKKLLNATLQRSEMARRGDDKILERVRWFFLMACYTGLRRVDQWQLINPRLTTIEGVTCLMAVQKKTGNRVPIPLVDEAEQLIRNPVDGKKPPEAKTYNLSLQMIGEQAELNRLVTVGSYYKGLLIADNVPLYTTMRSHMARRTFASRMADGGLNTFVLQEIMGHESIASTQGYTTVSNTKIVHQALAAWKNAKQTPPNK